MAIWTSGDPVSFACVWTPVMMSVFCALLSVTRFTSSPSLFHKWSS
jgi:hypothetical protein